MYSPLTDAWESSIRQSGVRITVADIYYNGGLVYENIGVSRYSVTADRKSSIRRSASIELVDADILAEFLSDSPTIEPYGIEVLLKAGVENYDGSEEVVPLGLFHIEDLAWSDDNQAMSMTMYDRSKKLERLTPIAPEWYGLQSVQTVITDIVQNTLINDLGYYDVTVTFDPDLDDLTLPANASFSGSWLDVVNQLCALLGAEGYFDVSGEFVVAPAPSITESTTSGDAVWVVDAGEDGVLIRSAKTTTRTEVYNVIYVIGGSPDSGVTGTFAEPPQAAVLDEDPASQTYAYGVFGQSSTRLEVQSLTTEAACYNYGLAYLNNSRGIAKSVTLTEVMNPALEPGDIIYVNFLDGTNELHLIDRITFNSDWSSTISTRSRVT